MGKLFTALGRLPKRTGAIIAVFIAAVIIPATLFAWGPSRQTYTVASPANEVVFNSITDNPHIGDERNFVNVRDAAITTDGGWQDTLTAEPGKEYLVRVYVHNNANANLNLKALNTRVKASVPTTTGKSVSISGFVSADNAKPGEVWDDIHFKSTKDFNLAYVGGSAEIFNNATGPNGKKLPDSIVTSAGAPVSYTEEGVIPGCFEFASYVYFKVKPQFAPEAKFDVQKTVRKSGDKDFVESVAVKPGDKVDYQIYYKNTGEQQMNNVVVRDILPAGMTYVSNTTWLHNSSGTRQVADGVTTNGLDIGGYMPSGDAYVKFTAQVAGNDALPTCGPNTLRNVAKVETDYGTKEDDANVTVPKECQPEAKYVCDSLSVDKINRTNFKLTTATIEQNATFKKVVYVIRNEQGTEIERKESTTKTLDYTRSEVGKYTVEALVTFAVNGADKTVTSENCKKPFEVEKLPETPVYTCDALTASKISRAEYSFTGTATATGGATITSYAFDFGDGTPMQTVTNPTDVKHAYAKDGTYTALLSVNIKIDGVDKTVTDAKCKVTVTVTPQECKPGVPVGHKDCEAKPECKPGIPVGDERCVEKPENCKVPGKEHLPVNSPDCKQAPVIPEVPSELPKTGAGDTLIAMIGAGSLIASVGYYIASRRGLIG